MADLPPNFEVPTPKPGRTTRPVGVSFAGWVLAVAGVLTGIGGISYLAIGTSGGEPLGLGLAAFGVAELVTGVEVLRLVAAFRPIGMAIAGVGAAIDVAGIVSGSRWQLIALLLHAAVLIALSTQREAFVHRGRLA